MACILPKFYPSLARARRQSPAGVPCTNVKMFGQMLGRHLRPQHIIQKPVIEFFIDIGLRVHQLFVSRINPCSFKVSDRISTDTVLCPCVVCTGVRLQAFRDAQKKMMDLEIICMATRPFLFDGVHPIIGSAYCVGSTTPAKSKASRRSACSTPAMKIASL